MYNLIVTGNEDDWEGLPFDIDLPRVFEYTNEQVKFRFQLLDAFAIAELVRLPCIFAYEITCNKPPKFGIILSVKTRENTVRVEYKIIDVQPFLTTEDIPKLEFNLGISNKWEMRRTHWAVKDVDLTSELKPFGITIPASTERNRITTVTRQHIADVMQMQKLWYEGKLNQPTFLLRLFDLKNMPSVNDDRYDNAYEDIYQHTVRNEDYELGWIYTDPRFNLLHCADESYLRFLAETLHPLVRNTNQISELLTLYNENLGVDGFEITQVSEISGKPIYGGREIAIGTNQIIANKAKIKRFLNTEYVSSQINIMNDAVNANTNLAIGTAKELLETACKSILKQKGVFIDPDWSLSKLTNETIGKLSFKPNDTDNGGKAEKSIKQILNGLSTTIHGITELRNAYGSGHGKEADFIGLEPKYAKLIVGIVSEIVILFLTTNGETAELVQTQTEIALV